MRDMKKFTSVKIRNLLFEENRASEIERIKYQKEGQKFKVWKDRYDCVIIKHGKVLLTKMKYIHENPVRKGFVDGEENWLYSSARFYKTELQGILPVTHAGKII
jgi:hypothetical protein